LLANSFAVAQFGSLGIPMSLPEIILAANRREAASVAQAILDSKITIIEGARLLSRLRHRTGVDLSDPDFLTFVSIDSQTDHLPFGEARRYWAAEPLAKLDQEIAECEAFFREKAFGSCAQLVSRFSHESAPPGAYEYHTPDT
jgi:Protein of unknown function (DUF2489)